MNNTTHVKKTLHFVNFEPSINNDIVTNGGSFDRAIVLNNPSITIYQAKIVEDAFFDMRMSKSFRLQCSIDPRPIDNYSTYIADIRIMIVKKTNEQAKIRTVNVLGQELLYSLGIRETDMYEKSEDMLLFQSHMVFYSGQGIQQCVDKIGTDKDDMTNMKRKLKKDESLYLIIGVRGIGIPNNANVNEQVSINIPNDSLYNSLDMAICITNFIESH